MPAKMMIKRKSKSAVNDSMKSIESSETGGGDGSTRSKRSLSFRKKSATKKKDQQPEKKDVESTNKKGPVRKLISKLSIRKKKQIKAPKTDAERMLAEEDPAADDDVVPTTMVGGALSDVKEDSFSKASTSKESSFKDSDDMSSENPNTDNGVPKEYSQAPSEYNTADYESETVEMTATDDYDVCKNPIVMIGTAAGLNQKNTDALVNGYVAGKEKTKEILSAAKDNCVNMATSEQVKACTGKIMPTEDGSAKKEGEIPRMICTDDKSNMVASTETGLAAVFGAYFSTCGTTSCGSLIPSWSNTKEETNNVEAMRAIKYDDETASKSVLKDILVDECEEEEESGDGESTQYDVEDKPIEPADPPEETSPDEQQASASNDDQQGQQLDEIKEDSKEDELSEEDVTEPKPDPESSSPPKEEEATQPSSTAAVTTTEKVDEEFADAEDEAMLNKFDNLVDKIRANSDARIAGKENPAAEDPSSDEVRDDDQTPQEDDEQVGNHRGVGERDTATYVF